MREIKFRGMDLQGRWHYGLVTHIQTSKGGYAEGWYISNAVGMPCAYPVRPETVSQYTGLKDKNGKEIYEGDLVRGPSDSRPVMGPFSKSNKRVQCVFEVRYGDNWFGAYWLKEHGKKIQRTYPNPSGVEVIGNIFENPELITKP